MDLISMAMGTALERAAALAEDHLSKARAVKSANIAACVEYLRAAQSAIAGLEEEVDEIFIMTKLVARFDWDKRAALYERLDRYLNRDRLRPLLGQAIKGIESCHEFAERDSKGFFRREEKADSVREVFKLLGQLSMYLASLGSTMDSDKVDKENFAGPSGLNLPELLRIQELLELLVSQPESAEAEPQRTELIDLVEQAQSSRVREGFAIVADSTRIIQELIVVFGLQRIGDGQQSS